MGLQSTGGIRGSCSHCGRRQNEKESKAKRDTAAWQQECCHPWLLSLSSHSITLCFCLRGCYQVQVLALATDGNHWPDEHSVRQACSRVAQTDVVAQTLHLHHQIMQRSMHAMAMVGAFDAAAHDASR